MKFEKPTLEQVRSTGMEVLTWIFLAFMSMVVFGYFYPHPNHGQTALPLLHVIDPELLTRDPASLSLSELGPRYFYLRVLAVLAWFDVDRLPQAFFMLYAITATIMAGGFLRLGEVLTRRREIWTALIFGSVISISVARQIGMNDFYWRTMTPSFLAGALALWGYYFALKERYTAAYVLFGIGSLFQLIVTSLGAGIITPWLIYRAWKSGKLRDISIGMSVWVVLTCLIALPTLMGGPETYPTYGYDLVETFAFIRAPHHWVPSQWPESEWLALAGVAFFLVGAAMHLRKSRTHLAGLIVSGVVCAAAALALNHVFVDIEPVAIVAKLQLARTVPFVQLILVITVFALASQLVERRRWVEAFLLVVALQADSAGRILAILGFGLLIEGILTPRKEPDETEFARWREVVVSVVSILTILGAITQLAPELTRGVSPDKMRRIFFFGALGAAVLGTGLVGRFGAEGWRRDVARILVIVAVIGSASMVEKGENRVVHVENFRKHELLDVAREMRQKTPKDALFLVPITGLSGGDVYFSLVSHRAVAVHYKNMPFEDPSIFEWRHRLERVFGRKLTRQNRNIRAMWMRAPFEQIYGAAREFDVDYLVIERPRVPASHRDQIIFQNSKYSVVDVDP